MSCPDKTQLEQLVASALSEQDSHALHLHLSQCPSCRQEVAFLSAVRAAMPNRAATACLSDEVIALLADGALPEPQCATALTHLSGCQLCMASLASLQRSLEEVAAESREPSADAMARAVAIGTRAPTPPVTPAAPATPRTSWSVRLFEISTPWRLALAGSAAGVVFLVAILVLQPAPAPQPSATPVIADEEATPAPAPADKTAVAHAPAPAPADETAVAQTTAPDTKPVAQPQTPAEGWSKTDPFESLTPADRERLFAQTQPAPAPAGTPGALGLAPTGASFLNFYVLGLELARIRYFAAHAASTPQLREQISASLTEFGPKVQAALRGSAQAQKLADYLGKLPALLREEQIDVLGQRLEVAAEALAQACAAQEPGTLGLALGAIAMDYELVGRLGQLGATPAPEAWPSADSVVRLRKQLDTSAALKPAQAQAILQGLDALTKESQAPHDPARAQRLLNELQRLREAVPAR